MIGTLHSVYMLSEKPLYPETSFDSERWKVVSIHLSDEG
jgi:hypothetical protein